MSSLISFINAFLSNLLVFLVFAVLIVVAVLVGINVRKNKNKKEELEKAAANVEEAFVKQKE